MDLSNYQIIVAEVNKIRNMASADKEDLIQDIYCKLLGSKATHITRRYVRRLIRNLRIDQKRRADRRPDLEYGYDYEHPNNKENI